MPPRKRRVRKRRKYQPYKQGIFKPVNKSKCLNTKPIEYRSKLESRVMMWCDKTTKVLKWSSERVIIPYYNPVEQTTRRYFIDIFMEVKSKKGTEKYIVEIKPKRQTVAPKPSNRKKASTLLYENKMWATNQAKWKAARKWAKEHEMKFMIMTEEDVDRLEKK